MRQKHSCQPKASAGPAANDIRRAIRRHFSAEGRVRIVLELLVEEGIGQSLHHVSRSSWKLASGAWQRERIKRQTIEYRRLQYRKLAD